MTGLGRFQWTSGLVFIAGALTAWKLELVGLLFVGELALALVAAWAMAANIANPRFWDRGLVLPLVFLAVTFFGYILADLINGTGSSNLLRGWARIGFLATDIVAIHYLCRRKTLNLLMLCLGLSAGLVLTVSPTDLLKDYKLVLALPITLTALCAGTLLKSRARYLAVSFALTGVGLLHVLMDYRSLGAVCFLSGAIVFAKSTERSRLGGICSLFYLTILLAGGITFFYSYTITSSAYLQRRQTSDSWRLASATAALDAIRRAPLLGNGSWATSSQVSSMFDASFAETSGHRQPIKGKLDMPGHSQFLQAWYEAGILGLAFFVYFTYSLFRTLWICVFRMQLDPLIPLAVFYSWISLYNVAFSPFAGEHRLHLAISVAVAAKVASDWNAFSRAQIRIAEIWSHGVPLHFDAAVPS
ncbi:MAG: O-antigen ligase family protein [Acidobacteriota bacterium]|nr:O-antigen ligase family protein [Acidobacteriota bacterium]